MNAACDACTCDGHVITGRVQSKNGAPISEVSISLAETPYKVLAQTNESGFFIALNACTSEELLFTKEGFVPVKLTASGLTSTTANVNAKLEIAGSANVILIFLNKSPKEQCLVSFLQRHPYCRGKVCLFGPPFANQQKLLIKKLNKSIQTHNKNLLSSSGLITKPFVTLMNTSTGK